jgi:two-component system NtrC family sensor kinase
MLATNSSLFPLWPLVRDYIDIKIILLYSKKLMENSLVVPLAYIILNAFYAVNEKMKSADAGYEPTISVSTKKTGNKITITVKANGNGIPQKVVDKIFQPFFTTKPTGQGTGLGLSLSYDIIKAHGGEIKVETKEGEFTEFVVHLPISS